MDFRTDHVQWLQKTRNDEEYETFDMKLRSRKSMHWSFVFPSYNNELIERLHRLSQEKVVYAAHAVCKDNTGRNFLQGFIKLRNRCRVSALTRLIGCGIFTVCPTTTAVQDAVAEIKTSIFWEVGDYPATTQGCRNDLIAFKEAAEKGAPMDTLQALHPKVFKNYPGTVQSLIRQRLLK